MSGFDDETINAALRRIEEITSADGGPRGGGGAREKPPPAPPVSVYEAFVAAEVKNIVPFGLFVELRPGLDGFCHISEVSRRYSRYCRYVPHLAGPPPWLLRAVSHCQMPLHADMCHESATSWSAPPNWTRRRHSGRAPRLPSEAT